MSELIGYLKPDFNCCNSFALSLDDKITPGTESLLSVIPNVDAWFALVLDYITQFADQVENVINFTIN